MNKRLEKGITLIALIITIILLLILAGITITTLGGENGLLAKVKKAKEAEIKAEMREELTLALHDLQIEKKAEATLDDVTQNWINEQIKKYECTIKDNASLSGKQVIMKKDKIIGKFIIDVNLNIVKEEYNESSIEFSYEIREIEGNKIKIVIIVKDEINGIKEVQMPDGTINTYSKKTQIGIDYLVELGVEYKIKITSESGEVIEKTIKIDNYNDKYLYNYGVDNKIVTGGWKGNTQQYSTFSELADNLYVNASSSTYSVTAITTNNIIEISNYNYLYCEVIYKKHITPNNSYEGKLGITKDNEYCWPELEKSVTMEVNLEKKIYRLNISDIKGKYYPVITGGMELKLYKIWFE